MVEYFITQAETPSPEEERTIHLGIPRGDSGDAGQRDHTPLCWVAPRGRRPGRRWAPGGPGLGLADHRRAVGRRSLARPGPREPTPGAGRTSGRIAGVHECDARDLRFPGAGVYERHGYRVYGQFDGFPAGHTHFHMAKTLAGPAPSNFAMQRTPLRGPLIYSVRPLGSTAIGGGVGCGPRGTPSLDGRPARAAACPAAPDPNDRAKSALATRAVGCEDRGRPSVHPAGGTSGLFGCRRRLARQCSGR